MRPVLTVAAEPSRTFSISERLGRMARRLSRALKPKPRPPAFREHDPRKRETTHLDPVTPAHLLGSGGRAEFFRLPRL